MRWDPVRLGAAAGVAYAALIIAGFFIPQPPVGAVSGQQLADYLSSNRTASLVSAVHVSLTTLFFFWFAAALKPVLRALEGGPGTNSTLAFGAAAVVAAMVWVVTGIFAGLSYRPPRDPAVLEAVWYAARGGYVLIGFPAAIFAGASGSILIRPSGIWRALGVIALIAALLELLGTTSFLIELGPLGFLGFVVLAVWVLATSIRILIHGGTTITPLTAA